MKGSHWSWGRAIDLYLWLLIVLPTTRPFLQSSLVRKRNQLRCICFVTLLPELKDGPGNFITRPQFVSPILGFRPYGSGLAISVSLMSVLLRYKEDIQCSVYETRSKLEMSRYSCIIEVEGLFLLRFSKSLHVNQSPESLQGRLSRHKLSDERKKKKFFW